ncbi:hypothetical protein [Peribacillus sp. Bi96]|uniref:hypothetical protein n=1 Tax=Peribacillus sp. Bi96 TaxID=2884273 RepID=UPI001E3D23E7|nr:hypothetical protein [Peribacillus sp. Bi96]
MDNRWKWLRYWAGFIFFRDVWEARKRIASIVSRTPLIQSTILSEKIEQSETLANSVLGGIGLDNQYRFKMV